jgi:hypothetical protein
MPDKIQILDALKRLLPSQFEEVLFRYEVPSAHLPPGSLAQQAMAVTRYAENANQLQALHKIIQEVANSAGHAAGGASAVFNQSNQQVQQQINIGQVGGNLNLQQAGRDIGGNSGSRAAPDASHADAEYQLASDKLHALRKALILETDAATKFKLQQQIAELERMLKG